MMQLTIKIYTSNKSNSSEQLSGKSKKIQVLSSFLGMMSAINMVLMASYVLTTAQKFSNIPPISQSLTQIYFTSLLIYCSAFLVIYGSYLILRKGSVKSAIINFSVGILIAFPFYFYYTFFYEVSFFDWLAIGGIPIGWGLLVPLVVSSLIIFYKSKI